MTDSLNKILKACGRSCTAVPFIRLASQKKKKKKPKLSILRKAQELCEQGQVAQFI